MASRVPHCRYSSASGRAGQRCWKLLAVLVWLMHLQHCATRLALALHPPCPLHPVHHLPPLKQMQVDFVKLLHDKLSALSLRCADTPDEWRFPRPSFKVRMCWRWRWHERSWVGSDWAGGGEPKRCTHPCLGLDQLTARGPAGGDPVCG